jgi:6-phosphofructokinase 1
MDFSLDNPKTQNGFLNHLEKRLLKKKHAVVVVAEGTGQHLFENEKEIKDASGNVIHNDIGIFLKNKIKNYFVNKNIKVSVKYIDPSYIIRSIPANANDSKFCAQLTHKAVHAAMAGRTDFLVGYWNSYFTLVPIPTATQERKKIDIEEEFWWNVLESTGQAMHMK